jgi:hypothetical protein
MSRSPGVVNLSQAAIMYMESTRKNGVSKGARAGIIAAVVIVVGIVFLLMGWFFWRNRKLKYTKELADAQEGVSAWPTKWPTRPRPGETSTQSRNRHGEPVELAPPAYDIAQPLPTYKASRLNQDALRSHELANIHTDLKGVKVHARMCSLLHTRKASTENDVMCLFEAGSFAWIGGVPALHGICSSISSLSEASRLKERVCPRLHT